MTHTLRKVYNNLPLQNSIGVYNNSSNANICYPCFGMEQYTSLFFELNDSAYLYRSFTQAVLRDSTLINSILHRFSITQIKPYNERCIPNTSQLEELKSLKPLAERIIDDALQEKNADKVLCLLVARDASLFYHSLEVMCHAVIMGYFLGYNNNVLYPRYGRISS